MSLDPVTAMLDIGSKVIERLFPDPTQAASAKLELIRLQQTGELAMLAADTDLMKAQLAVNQAEASNNSLFVSGWRPAIGWTCGAAFAFKFVVGPAAVVCMALAGHPIVLPVFDFTEMSTILMGMLGLGALRTVEKIKAVA